MEHHLFMHRIFKLLGKSLFFENDYGIKVYNKRQFQLNKEYSSIEISPENVHLGFDGLKNQYTLLHRTIMESPHFDLVERIYEGKPIDECEYIARERKGCLDGRYNLTPNITRHQECFYKTKEDIELDNYIPINIYRIDSDYYVMDGKHRLAVCCLLKKKSRCYVFDTNEIKQDSYTKQLLLHMKGKKEYTQNVFFINRVFDCKDGTNE